MNLSKISMAMEKVWLAIALASFIFWGYKSYMTSMFEARSFLYVALVAAAIFIVRQGVRKNFERKQREQEEKENQK